MDNFFKKYSMGRLEEHALEVIEDQLDKIQKLCKKGKDYGNEWRELKEMIAHFESEL